MCKYIYIYIYLHAGLFVCVAADQLQIILTELTFGRTETWRVQTEGRSCFPWAVWHRLVSRDGGTLTIYTNLWSWLGKVSMWHSFKWQNIFVGHRVACRRWRCRNDSCVFVDVTVDLIQSFRSMFIIYLPDVSAAQCWPSMPEWLLSE